MVRTVRAQPCAINCRRERTTQSETSNRAVFVCVECNATTSALRGDLRGTMTQPEWLHGLPGNLAADRERRTTALSRFSGRVKDQQTAKVFHHRPTTIAVKSQHSSSRTEQPKSRDDSTNRKAHRERSRSPRKASMVLPVRIRDTQKVPRTFSATKSATAANMDAAKTTSNVAATLPCHGKAQDDCYRHDQARS